MTEAVLDQRPTALLVLGMHRSGTSALTGTLGLLGVDLGRRLIDPGPDNRKGYWEHSEAVLAHESLLEALDSAWDDIDPLPEDWRDRPAAEAAKAAIARLVDEEFANSPLWAVKDPRLCRLLPLWLDVLAARGIRPALLYVIRHPGEIAASLRARDHLHPEASALLTLRHLLEAERAGRGCTRAVLAYDELMAAPAAALSRVAGELGIAWPMPPSSSDDAIRAFLDPDERHHHIAPAKPARLDIGRFEAIANGLHDALLGIAAGQDRWSDVSHVADAINAATRGSDDVVIELHRLCSRRARRVAARLAAAQAELRARHAEDESAISRLEQLSLERLSEMRRLAAQLAETQVALANAERLSLERLAHVEELDRALGEVTRLSLDRLTQIETLTRQAEDAERVLAEACRSTLGHLEEASGLDTRVAVTAEAILELSEQSLTQRQRIQMLEASQETLSQALASEHARREAMERSLSWRITQPLRTVRRALSRRRPA